MNFLKYEDFLNEAAYNKPVDSSHLENIKYDSETRKLEIEFWDGSVYRYFDVPPRVFRIFGDEKTKLDSLTSGVQNLFSREKMKTYGTRFWKMIRREDYKYEKIKDAKS
jgi:hypothetical protein